MTDFSKLDQVRELARARAQEDFEYLACHVFGFRFPCGVCAESAPTLFPHAQQQRQFAQVQQAWLFLQGRAERPSNTPETFDWLFGAERRTAQRAA